MTLQQFKRVLESKPFKPFTMRLGDGSRIRVPHPDFIYMHPEAPRTIVVAMPDATYTIVDLLLVAAIDVGNGKAARARR